MLLTLCFLLFFWRRLVPAQVERFGSRCHFYKTTRFCASRARAGVSDACVCDDKRTPHTDAPHPRAGEKKRGGKQWDFGRRTELCQIMCRLVRFSQQTGRVGCSRANACACVCVSCAEAVRDIWEQPPSPAARAARSYTRTHTRGPTHARKTGNVVGKKGGGGWGNAAEETRERMCEPPIVIIITAAITPCARVCV